MGDFLLGEIKLWPMDWAPEGWALCNGQLLSIQQYTALYSLIGLNYGGNGTSTFGLPDLRGRVPVGYGVLANTTSGYDLGEVGGHETQVLSQAQMPAHVHSNTLTGLSASLGVGTSSASTITEPTAGSTVYLTAATASISGDPVAINGLYTSQAPTGSTAQLGGLQVTATGGSVQTGTAGSSQPVDMRQPFQVVNYIICTSGLYPTRP